MFAAIRQDYYSKINVALANIDDINDVVNEDGTTPLMEAVCKFQDDIVRILLEKGSEPNRKDKDDYSAIIYACMTENINALKILEKYGADINSIGKDGHDLLYHSFFSTTESRHTNIKTKKEIIKFLVEKNIDVNRIDPFLNWGVYHYIVYNKGMHDLIDIFYEKNKNIDLIDDKKQTPLELCIFMDDPKTFKKLFDYGADPFKGNDIFKKAIAVAPHDSFYYDLLKKRYPEIIAATELNIL